VERLPFGMSSKLTAKRVCEPGLIARASLLTVPVQLYTRGLAKSITIAEIAAKLMKTGKPSAGHKRLLCFSPVDAYNGVNEFNVIEMASG